ncbi:uncharacterized protein LOC135683283 [Rhopilema esculentum]|uniref:uncharacterized protein LOC135683283 n=1 Tax=Rhopilema esculentum TaxID=499914 RepID=UPI0031CFF9C7
MCLLLESHEIAANSPKTFCILLPSDACGMLLKCVANIDVVLPLSNSLCIQKQSETIQTQIDALLIELPRTSSLNPLALKSGISDKLLEAFKPSETKKNPKAVKRQICDSDYRPNTKELARSGRSENVKSLSQKKAKCPYRPAFTKGSIMERGLREFPDDFRANNEYN